MQKFFNHAGIILFMFIFLLLSCQEKKEVIGTTQSFEIATVTIPSVVSSTSDKAVLFTAKVTHPDGDAGIAEVQLQITDSLGALTRAFTMYDDGDVQGQNSGDVIAFDQVYSIIIVGSQSGIPDGRYSAKIKATSKDGSEKESPSSEMEVFPNQVPEILNVTFPDSIVSGMKPTDILFTVNDNDGLEDILWVLIQGYDSVSSFPVFQDTIFNPMDNSPVFSATIDSSYGAGKIGHYLLKCFAEDRVRDKSNIVEKAIYVENEPPDLSNAGVPDTLNLPPSGDVRVEITVKVKDPQSLADIDSVYFNSYLPNGNPATSNPFLMYDNGLPYDPFDPVAVGDAVAGDGIYTLSIFLPYNTNPGQYRFEFFARDKVGHLGIGPIATLQVR
jgi:hypothetical protein